MENNNHLGGNVSTMRGGAVTTAARLSPSRRPLLTVFVCLLALSLSGCPRRDTTSETRPKARPFEGVSLRLLVADDPALAAVVGKLRGEWNAQTGSDLQVDQINQADLEGTAAVADDAIVAPAHLLGPLAERDLLAPMPKELLDGADWSDLFDLLKLREVSWGNESDKKVKAVPFGSPVFVCYYRADLLAKLNRRPPQSWDEYQELAKLLAAQKPPGGANWSGTIEPLGPGWAGLVLLARAAPYAKHRDSFSTLFNVDTMEPLLNTPAMIRALEELVAAAKAGPSDPLAVDPAAARVAFWKGQCGMALTWPTAATQGGGRRAESGTRKVEEGKTEIATPSHSNPQSLIPNPFPPDPAIRVGFAELPGTKRVYNLSTHAWDVRADDEDQHVPLLDACGRLGMVSKNSSHPEVAFRLLLWLTDNERSSQVSAASPATTLFRRSQAKSVEHWVEKPVGPAVAAQYAATTEATFRREQWLSAIPLPGRAEYLAALDEAVRAAVGNQKPAAEVLAQAQAKWRAISERLGVERQRAAYRHSLGW
jgi:multiple sugar transport system substrate-binding protein